MWQYGTMRVTDAFWPTNPNEALVKDTNPSLALASNSVPDRLGV
jgi:hypothetical protein